MRVLLLENDELLGSSLHAFLRHGGDVVDWCRLLLEAEALKREPFDAFVVDWTLPDGSGFEWVKSLRARGFALPIIMMMSSDRPEDRVMALDAGADDCLVKPLHPEELAARIRANCRRAVPATLLRLQIRNVELDVTGRVAVVDGTEAPLTRREWSLLEALVQRQGRFVSKADLAALVIGNESAIGGNALEVHISSLRRKLGRDLIETARGVGYRLML